ncbi:hypothetical protein San01_36040 [Streptomyces angustmyceticus]|uniref:Uncharacterized protein n=1 Tax=Streptomyces angustmyceticus TaxID=285578 RepID=A0A5J4L9S9_9ACTN|nr:hypothetical protein San01_36040 [Streptomyces angustmyceticus]
MTGRVPYVSPACHVGTHARCTKGGPVPEAGAVPGVRREACICRCHAPDGARPGGHQAAGSPAGTAKTVPFGAAA